MTDVQVVSELERVGALVLELSRRYADPEMEYTDVAAAWHDVLVASRALGATHDQTLQRLAQAPPADLPPLARIGLLEADYRRAYDRLVGAIPELRVQHERDMAEGARVVAERTVVH